MSADHSIIPQTRIEQLWREYQQLVVNEALSRLRRRVTDAELSTSLDTVKGHIERVALDLWCGAAGRAILDRECMNHAKTDSYKDGYETGRNWKYSYNPGGPFCYPPRATDSTEFRIKAEATMQAYRDWHRGFNAARKDVETAIRQLVTS